ncbi:MFS transporter [Sphingomonas hengshuiensis]|uniref:MFS transporter n=1 Tax=Sphingomonas hengshuiensis TaxID=1609977 RepID=A0A7U4J7Q9_9SPHN|nr:MFS transporter [Sphingomonas hengshuiensis]AJP71793.1 MFS transporter [Sphingomonas hengshuiensis]
MGGFAIGTTEYATMSLLPFFSTGLGIDEPTAGHVISAYALGVVVGAPLLAVVAARLSRRVVLIALMLLFGLANGLSALAPDYGWMLFFRFLSGLPHGAYFGMASLVAASLVPTEMRTRAVARVMLGLTVATIVGVPFANWVGQLLGWRWGFGVVALIALATAAMIAWVAPRDVPDAGANPLSELRVLRRGQLWLTLGIGAIGYGGLFCVYTYLASTLLEVTQVSAAMVPVALAVFGAGMTLGNLIAPRFADRAVMPTAGALLIWSIVALAIYPFAIGQLWSILLVVLAIGIGGALGTVLQTRLMDIAREGQGLAAALNHSAFNVANAIGPWAGGIAIAAGLGWRSVGWVGAGLALGGLLLWAIAMVTARPARS